MNIDKERLKRLERIEQYAEQLHKLWQGDLISEPDQAELEDLMTRFMRFMTWGYDGQ